MRLVAMSAPPASPVETSTVTSRQSYRLSLSIRTRAREEHNEDAARPGRHPLHDGGHRSTMGSPSISFSSPERIFGTSSSGIWTQCSLPSVSW